MTPERFHALLDSCGADLRRWPEAERDAARALLASDSAALRAAHAEAAMLDRDLDAYEIAPRRRGADRSDRRCGRVGSASAGRARSWWRLEPFWPRAGWALTGLAGAVAGALVVSVALGDSYPGRRDRLAEARHRVHRPWRRLERRMNDVSLRRWLVASLVLNVFIVGAVAGGAARWWFAERSVAAAEPPRGLRHAADDLPAEQRRNFLVGLRNARRAVAEPLQAAREGRQEVLRLLREPRFEADAVAQTLARTRAADMAARERFEAAVVDFASTLSPPERQKLADGLARRSAQTSSAASSSRP